MRSTRRFVFGSLASLSPRPHVFSPPSPACSVVTDVQQAVGVDLKEQSPYGNGSVICFSVYAGPQHDFGNGPRVWVDTLGPCGPLLDVFKPYLENRNIKKVRWLP